MKIEIRDEYNLKLYGDKTSFELEEGLIFLVGCNGGGKTSLLKEIKDQFKKDKIQFVSVDARYDFHKNDLNGISKSFDIGNILMGNFESEHEAYERYFYNWIGGIRPGDEYKGKAFGFFIDGIDSGGDVYFYQKHLDFFKGLLNDCKNRGIIPYLVVTCNNFYYLSKSKIGKCLFVPKLEYKGFYNSAQYDDYVQDILETAKVRGF